MQLPINLVGVDAAPAGAVYEEGRALPPAHGPPQFVTVDPTRLPADLQQFWHALNAEQQQAASLVRGHSAVLGVPGGGKTATMVFHIAHLVRVLGVRPDRICAMTFTRNAADEMKKRLALLGVAVEIGTIHSIARRVLSRFEPYLQNVKLDEKNNLVMVLKRSMSELRREKAIPQRGVDTSYVFKFISDTKARGGVYIEGDRYGTNNHLAHALHTVAVEWADPCGCTPMELERIAITYERRRYQAALYDFDDMLLWAWMSLAFRRDVLAEMRGEYDFLFVDEAQDSNAVQWDLVHLLAGLPSCVLKPPRDTKDEQPWEIEVDEEMCPPEDPGSPMTVVTLGDPSQCQPGDALVATGDGYVRMEDLKIGQKLTRWDRHSGTAVHTGVLEDKRARRFVGDLLRVRVQERSTRVTPNHQFLCRWTEKPLNRYVTYMMYREGFGFRVGWCQLFRKLPGGSHGSAFHLGHRCRLERADAVWILKAFDDKAQASFYESFVSAHWGIPCVLFEEAQGNKLYTEARIRAFYAQCLNEPDSAGRRLLDRGSTCLAAHGRDVECPLYPDPYRSPKGGRVTYFKVFASNLEPGLMSIPLPEGRNTWAPIDDVTWESFEGNVYSLKVSHDELYVADGLVTHNSIYKFRGSIPELMVDWAMRTHTVMLPLSQNYRSVPAICSASESVIRGKAWNLTPDIRPSGPYKDINGPGYGTHFQQYPNTIDEMRACIDWVIESQRQGMSLQDIVVLARTSIPLDVMEIECIRRRVPYVKMTSGTFFDSAQAKDILGYLQVACGHDGDGYHFKRILNKPYRYIGSDFRDRCISKAASSGAYVMDVMQREMASLGYKQRQAIQNLIRTVQKMNRMYVEREELKHRLDRGDQPPHPLPTVADMVQTMIDDTDYVEGMRREEGVGEDEQRLMIIEEVKRIAHQFISPTAFIEYVYQLKHAIREAGKTGLRKRRVKDKGDALTLSTVHRYKGLEAERVWVVDLSEGRFPHRNNVHDPDEELRLLYVAVSRAKQLCVLSTGSEPSEFAGFFDARYRKGKSDV